MTDKTHRLATEAYQALRLIATNRLAAASALQRWMHISFARANNLLDELHEHGYVGPADGSKSRAIYVQICEQCGRIGKRGFETRTRDDISVTVCTTRAACRKRWPKPVTEETP